MAQGFEGKVEFTAHFVNQVKAKGLNPEDVIRAIRSPYKVTEVTRYPGQLRYCGSGVAVVMDESFAITVYLDGVCTPLREGQKSDSAACSSARVRRAS
jgi:hypothetical protein